MSENSQDSDLEKKLLESIKARRTQVKDYIKNMEQRGNRLTNLSIICTAVTAVLTAGPGLGRDNFVQAMQKIFNTQDVSIWGTLCLLATILSVVAAVVNNMNKRQDTTDRLVRAHGAVGVLEKLETSLEFDTMPAEDVTKLYQQCLADISFIQ